MSTDDDMTDDERRSRYRDLVEVSARAIAFAPVCRGDVPKLAVELQVEAIELIDGWKDFDAKAPPGSQDLPIADRVADEVFERANELRRLFMAGLTQGVADTVRDTLDDALDGEGGETTH
jgi:hypothetical protein